MKDLKFLNEEHTMISMIDKDNKTIFAFKNFNEELFDRAINGEFGEITPYSVVEKQRKYEEDIVVEKVKLKYVLLKYKVLSDFEYIVSQMDEITKLVWNDSTHINKENSLMVLLQKSVKFPDGSDITKDDINEIFIEAEKIEII